MWNERYGKVEFYYGTAPNDFLKAEAARWPGGSRIVSLGEGEGRNAVFLAQHCVVTGVDGSEVGLAKAQRLATACGVELTTVVADLAVYDLGVSAWDGVVSVWCHLPTALRLALHGRIARALKPGGLVLFEHYHPRQLEYRTGGPSDVALLLTLDELKAAYSSPMFDVLHAAELEREVHEGEGHGGPSFVTQFIARKRG